MTTTTNSASTPPQIALAAAVPGARGWFRYGTELGAVNVRLSGAVQAVAYDDGAYRILAVGGQAFELRVGPFTSADEASDVADAVLRLAYNDVAWPNS